MVKITEKSVKSHGIWKRELSGNRVQSELLV